MFTVDGSQLSAYDAKGVTGCSGSPKVCSPLWTASTGGTLGSPAVVNGVLYVGSDQLYAVDAAGTIGCAGTPRTCSPLWTSVGSVGTTPAVADGRVFLTDGTSLSAFDAAGQQGCTTGSQRQCEPLWRFEREQNCSSGCTLTGPPVVAGGRVYVIDNICCSMGFSVGSVLAFDSAGLEGCSGTPLTCFPIKTGPLHTQRSMPKAGLAIANGRVFASDMGMTVLGAGQLDRLWQDGPGSAMSGPSVANGVVYDGLEEGDE